MLELAGGAFGAFDFDVDGTGAVADGRFEDANLLLDRAVKAAVVLVPAAGGEDGNVGIGLEKAGDGGGAGGRIREVVETEFEKTLAAFDFSAGVLEQFFNRGQPEGDADLRELLGKRFTRGHDVRGSLAYHWLVVRM